MPKIIVQDLQHVLIDGVNFGAVADTIINNKDLASDVQIALVVWNDAQVASVKAASELTAKTSSDMLAKAVSAKDAEIAAANVSRDSVAVELAALKTLSESLLDQARKIDHPEVQAIVAEADKPENQRKKDALQAQIVELTKQFEEIK